MTILGLSPEDSYCCPWPKCDFEVKDERTEVSERDILKHLLVTHSLVICDLPQILDLKQYLRLLSIELCVDPASVCSSVPLSEVPKEVFEASAVPREELTCTTLHIRSDALSRDLELRLQVQQATTGLVLEVQRRERNSNSFERGCLFCRRVFRGNRRDLFDHMSFEHHFSVGKPDNLVFAEEFLSVLENLLRSLRCFTCEKTFKDRTVLKEHMRKKFHKRLNPKNRLYDKFYLINYLEMGKNWEDFETIVSLQNDKDEECVSDDPDWSDWTAKSGVGSEMKCLFCPLLCWNVEEAFSHHVQAHGFDIKEQLIDNPQLNFYQKVKIVNYIRKQVIECRCILCDEEAVLSWSGLCSHMALVHASQSKLARDGTQEDATSSLQCNQLPKQKLWDQPQYFFRMRSRSSGSDSASGFLTDSASGFLTDSASGFLTDSASGFLTDSASGFLTDSASGDSDSASLVWHVPPPKKRQPQGPALAIVIQISRLQIARRTPAE
ncbi:unnamed protein product [Cyprideis torosa]|uniref:Uncharacterized protein n=1 Tax=Cyprideis torosa TaxID=163714 RepID=A0A7R8ZM64_9CRUS|nr:unnamed protein product [Cyprideis torosa]CAG0885138.1 unnamed protein product [Cyprideis torosa]